MRRVPSNRMPSRFTAGEPLGIGFVACCACLLVATVALAAIGLVAAVWTNSLPQFLTVVTLFLGVTVVGNAWHSIHSHRLRLARPKDSICTFAREFNYRATDTWIIRAVYEALESRASFPIRSTDRFTEELWLDDDDLDDEVFDEVARRAGRSTENCEQNPMYGQVKTVADLVAFFSHQPRVSPR